MALAFDFEKQMVVGNDGEGFFTRCYPDIAPVKSTVDLAFDFNSSLGGIELKTDTYDMTATPNFFFERYSDMKSCKLGGPWRSFNDGVPYFVYLFSNNQIFFWFKPAELVAFLDEYTKTLKYKTIRNKAWTTSGYCVPRDAVKHLYEQHSFTIDGKPKEGF